LDFAMTKPHKRAPTGQPGDEIRDTTPSRARCDEADSTAH